MKRGKKHKAHERRYRAPQRRYIAKLRRIWRGLRRFPPEPANLEWAAPELKKLILAIAEACEATPCLHPDITGTLRFSSDPNSPRFLSIDETVLASFQARAAEFGWTLVHGCWGDFILFPTRDIYRIVHCVGTFDVGITNEGIIKGIKKLTQYCTVELEACGPKNVILRLKENHTSYAALARIIETFSPDEVSIQGGVKGYASYLKHKRRIHIWDD